MTQSDIGKVKCDAKVYTTYRPGFSNTAFLKYTSGSETFDDGMMGADVPFFLPLVKLTESCERAYYAAKLSN